MDREKLEAIRARFQTDPSASPMTQWVTPVTGEVLMEVIDALLAPEPGLQARMFPKGMCSHPECRPPSVGALTWQGGPTWPCRR